jgi:hypothetical protein
MIGKNINNKIMEYGQTAYNRYCMRCEKPQSVYQNGAYRLSKMSIPFSQTMLAFFEKAQRIEKKSNFAV